MQSLVLIEQRGHGQIEDVHWEIVCRAIDAGRERFQCFNGSRRLPQTYIPRGTATAGGGEEYPRQQRQPPVPPPLLTRGKIENNACDDDFGGEAMAAFMIFRMRGFFSMGVYMRDTGK